MEGSVAYNPPPKIEVPPLSLNTSQGAQEGLNGAGAGAVNNQVGAMDGKPLGDVGMSYDINKPATGSPTSMSYDLNKSSGSTAGTKATDTSTVTPDKPAALAEAKPKSAYTADADGKGEGTLKIDGKDYRVKGDGTIMNGNMDTGLKLDANKTDIKNAKTGEKVATLNKEGKVVNTDGKEMTMTKSGKLEKAPESTLGKAWAKTKNFVGSEGFQKFAKVTAALGGLALAMGAAGIMK